MEDSIKIMLIDDDPMTNMVHKAIIKRLGLRIEVWTYLQAEEALTYLKAHACNWPEFIFLDINMPVMNGWQFLDAYCELSGKAELFMLSSSIDPKDMTRSQQYPVVRGFISKPLTVEILRTHLGILI